MLIVLCVMPAAYASDVQFHLITEMSNTFPLLPPDRPRPANIIGEAAHLTIKNPPAGMFVLTAHNGTTQHITPLQAGMDTAGFRNGDMIRVITDSAWDSGTEYTFRDQPFGLLAASGTTMYQASAMPLRTGWNSEYTQLSTTQDSRFGLGTGTVNTIGYSSGTYGAYTIYMNGRDRVGLDFGPVQNSTLFIYRGCIDCKSDIVIGFGNPSDVRSILPNDLTVVDHYRGWLSTSSCSTSGSTGYSGTGTRSIQADYTIPSPAHSRAGDHTIPNRYADLSILPNSHSSCTGTLYSENNDDNRKHDMCVTSTSKGASTTYTYPYTRTVTTETYLNGTLVSTTTSTSTGSVTRGSTGADCSTPTTLSLIHI